MPNATTTTYLNIESVGGDKLIASMAALTKSLNFAAGMIKDLNKGLGISSSNSKKAAQGMDLQAKAASFATENATQLRLAMAAQAVQTEKLVDVTNKLSKTQEEANKKKGLDWTALKSKLELAKGAFLAVTGAIKTVGSELVSLSAIYDVQAQAEEKLQRSLNAAGIKGNIDSLKEWAGQIQATTTAGDEMVLGLASQAAKFAKNKEQIKDITKAALNFSAATGKDATEAIKTIGEAAAGNAGSLRKLGIYLTKSQKEAWADMEQKERLKVLMAELTKQYDGFAEAIAATPTGELVQIENIIGDIKEQVGELMEPSLYAVLYTIKNWLLEQQSTLVGIVDEAGGIESAQKMILAGTEKTAEVLIDIVRYAGMAKNVVEIIADSFQVAVGAIFKPFGEIFRTMTKIPGLADETKKNFQLLGDALAINFDAGVLGLKQDLKDIDELNKNADALKVKLRESIKLGGQEYFDAASRRKKGRGGGETERGGVDTISDQEPVEFKMQLDEKLQAELDYESKRLAIIADFKKKREALETWSEGDQERMAFAAQKKKEFAEQEGRELANIELELARQTGNEKALIDDEFRRQKAEKDKSALEQQKAEQMAMLEGLKSGLQSVSALGLDMFEGWIEGTGNWKEQLYDGLKSFSKNMMSTGLASILQSALINQAKAQESQANIPVIGPALALAAGATMFAITMALRSKLKPAQIQKMAVGGYISAGMVKGGSFGRDSVPALLEPGERVLSKKETEAYDSRANRATVQNITINISGQLSTPAQITDTVRRVLVPELRAAARAGYAY